MGGCIYDIAGLPTGRDFSCALFCTLFCLEKVGQHRERDYAGIRAESQEENIFKIQKPLHTFSLFYAVPYYNPNGCSVLYFTKIYFLVSN